jgi:hypothetical protein
VLRAIKGPGTADIKYPSKITLTITLTTRTITCLGTGAGTGTVNNSQAVTQPSGSSGGGCLSADTLILLANGSYKPIKDVQIGEQIIIYNEKTQKFEISPVVKAYAHKNTPRMLEILFLGGHKIQITPGHPLLTTKG